MSTPLVNSSPQYPGPSSGTISLDPAKNRIFVMFEDAGSVVRGATSSVGAGATATYSVFVTGTGTVPFDPANNRINVEFKDAGGVVRGSTSVAVRTQ